ncbi:MAG TPA: phage tail protein [Oceanobacillus sp.]|nr:phage tail protein [Oceanobacillus sp.]
MPPLGKPPELHAGFRFVVKVDNVNTAAFTECTLPKLQVETLDIKEGGQNEYIHRLPVRVNAGTVTLKHGVTRSDELLKWYMDVLKGKIGDAMRDVTISIFDVTLKTVVAKWSFKKAYPIRYGAPALRAGDDAIAIEELELAHQGFTVD